MNKEKEALSLLLPDGVLEWFDIVKTEKDIGKIHFTLEEKNIPPISKKNRGKKVVARGFTDITVTDFPARGRKMILTFRRRYWQVEEKSEMLKRNIDLCASGTQLEKEFAAFLKERS